MTMPLEEFMEKTGAELVGSRLVYGERAERRYVGSVEDGAFNLNDEGKQLMDALAKGMDPSSVNVEPARKRGRPPMPKDE